MDRADFVKRGRAVFIGSVGNLVEWYDFYAYAAFALYFAHQFFPGDDVVVQQLNAALLFAFGFLVRPLGSIIFGHIADRRGRRTALTLSVALMCFGADRHHADLRFDRGCRADHVVRRALAARFKPRR